MDSGAEGKQQQQSVPICNSYLFGKIIEPLLNVMNEHLEHSHTEEQAIKQMPQ